MDTAAVTAMTAALDFSPIVVGIGAVGAATIVVAAAIWGMKKLRGGVS